MKYFIITIFIVFLAGCSKPLPDDNNDFVGLWKNNETSLLITKSGRIEYESNKGAVKTSISFPIKEITNTELIAGFLFINSTFTLSGQPRMSDGLTILTVDGDDLYKVGDDGRVVLSLTVPKHEVIKKLINKNLNLLSEAILKNDFSKYIDYSADEFQQKFTNESLLTLYQPFIEQKVNLSRWMAGEPTLTIPAYIKDNGVLTFSGKYPTSPSSLKFTLSFVYSNNEWRNLGPHVKINSE